MKPKISLIMPTYNVEKYVGEAIDSVRKQTLDSQSFEFIIINDGSTDKTHRIIKEKIKGMTNVIYINRIENKGVSFTRNEAINLSSGNWIALLDGDDFLVPKALKSTLDFHKKNTLVQYSYSQYARINENGETIGDKSPYDYNKEDLLRFNFVSHLKCFSREIHNKIGGFDVNTMVEDWDHALKASEILRDKQIACNKKVLYYYRIHGINRSIFEAKKTRESAIQTLSLALKRRELNGKVKFDGKMGFEHSYFSVKLFNNGEP